MKPKYTVEKISAAGFVTDRLEAREIPAAFKPDGEWQLFPDGIGEFVFGLWPVYDEVTPILEGRNDAETLIGFERVMVIR